MSFCAIDFGTSNSAIAIPASGQGASAMRLVPLEGEHLTMPTAVFYCTDADDVPPGTWRGTHRDDMLPRTFGRAAVKAYIDGYEGRLMRSMKSILGTALVDQTTEVGNGLGVKYLDVITGYLRHLRSMAEKAGGQPLTRVVMGRPVFFVDEDPVRDAAAQASLEAAARAVGFEDIAFQFEPIAAAFDYEQQAQSEELVLVADIGGGTSDFSVVRVGPDRRQRLERRDDILANHGVHIAGTDFDRRVSLASVMPPMGYGAFGPSIQGQPPRPVPSRVYFDLTTWHLINTVYQPQRMAELRSMIDFYGEPLHHQRLMKVVQQRLGHALVGEAEAAKIAVASGGEADIALDLIESGLRAHLSANQTEQALRDDLARIVACAHDTVKQAGVQASDIRALYFTGGSTGLKMLTDQLEAAFPDARAVRGDRLASVATGLGLHAARLFAD
ncbi:MAG: Hsp70 family protein [Aquabacterium sp.]|uniref:Hsp70 family protein n=1 Tax=Aquabacterium sp. TaxID=1872578 RepID=UPI003BE228D2